MRIFLTKVFARFAAKERIDAALLRDAVRRAETGLVDANLGGGVIKQRIARAGRGKSGGHRAIVLYRMGSRAIFAYGFSKNVRDNIDAHEIRPFREAARELSNVGEFEIAEAVASGMWRETTSDDEDLP